MKLCEKCGTPQKDENFRCVECGTILPKPLNEKEEEIIENQISDYIDEHASRTDPFYVSRADKVMIAVDLAGLLASVVTLLFFSPTSDEDALSLVCIFLFAFSALDTAFPQIQWFFEKLRVEMHYHVEHLEPSDLYLIGRKIMIYAIPVLAALGLLAIHLHKDPPREAYQQTETGVYYFTGTSVG